jgi:hypothetical protein
MNTNANTKETLASAKLNMTFTKKGDLVTESRKAIDAVKQHPEFANNVEMQQCITTFEAATNAVEAGMKAIEALRVQEAALLGAEVGHVADCKRSAKKLVALVNEVTRGSAQGIKQWGLGVRGRAPTVETTASPTGLRATYDKALVLSLRWDAVLGHRGYEVQIGTGAPDGWGPAIHVPRASFKPTGLTPGQHVAFRVAVHRGSGVSEYSDALTLTAR